MYIFYHIYFIIYIFFQQLHFFLLGKGSIHYAFYMVNPEVDLIEFFKERKVMATLKPIAS